MKKQTNLEKVKSDFWSGLRTALYWQKKDREELLKTNVIFTVKPRNERILQSKEYHRNDPIYILSNYSLISYAMSHDTHKTGIYTGDSLKAGKDFKTKQPLVPARSSL